MTIIQKYQVAQNYGSFTLPLVEGATVLSCKWIESQVVGLVGVTVFAAIDDGADPEDRTFYIKKTGDQVPAASTYVGSVEDSGDNLFHVYLLDLVP